jgi:hypothetical protein
MFFVVKYMLLCYGNQESWDTLGQDAGGRASWSEKHVNEMFDHMNTLNQELIKRGELVVGAGLADPTHTTTVRSQNGEPLVTDGPYLEAKEFLAGWWVVDCANYDRVAEIAVRISDAPSPDGPMGARVEIRPVSGTVK